MEGGWTRLRIGGAMEERNLAFLHRCKRTPVWTNGEKGHGEEDKEEKWEVEEK